MIPKIFFFWGAHKDVKGTHNKNGKHVGAKKKGKYIKHG